ncbi:MAG TPA: GtrA family protein, partial [Acidobacteriaceae bacterium]
MNILARWWKFNLVGLIGFGLQMTALSLLRRVCGAHDLLASAAALELTVVHNFIWHLHYTWRDRSASSQRMQFARFQLSNGLVSLTGNLLLVRLLVGATHIPLLAANVIAVLCCAVANFYLGDFWAFAPDRDEASRARQKHVVGPPG